MRETELIHCRKCGDDSELYYIDYEVISSKPCKCRQPELIRPDWMEVIKPIIDDFKKRSENVTRHSKSFSEVSSAIKTDK
jgi:hypothetical protein